MKLVGISGYARSGKDTIADILVEQCGFQRVAFADKLREAAYALDPTVWDGGYDYDSLAHIIDYYGWDGYKDTAFGPEIRRVLQRLGTEVGRNILGDNIWVDTALRGLDDKGRYVFPDCRFENEALAIRELGGHVWRVNRPGVEPANDHISEIGLDDFYFDEVIENDDSVARLADKVWLRAHRL